MRKQLLSAVAAGFVWLTLPAGAYGQPGNGQTAAPPAPELTRKAATWVATLQLPDARQAAAVRDVVAAHLQAIHAHSQAHPYTDTPAGINPTTGQPLSTLERQLIAQSALPPGIHEALMTGLRQHLTPAQAETILDQYTIGKVAFTLRGYRAIVPDLTPAEEQVLLTNLQLAREQAVDYPSMKQISAVFEIYKTRNEEYLNTHGRNWRALFKTYTDAVKAQKAANQATAAPK